MGKSKKQKAEKKRKKRKKMELTARTADPHVLYQESVQDVDWCVEFIDRVYKSEHDRLPTKLREDFCGTALLCAAWVKSRDDRTAVGLDLDRPTLDWGIEKNIAPLGDSAGRVELLERDVLVGTRAKVDVTVAFNFSYWAIHDRKEMVRYFRNVRRSLADGGAFFLDFHGGPDAQNEVYEKRKEKGFHYHWEQGTFDPINNRSTSWIHFKFKDGSKLRKAFTYDWRIWALPEIRDVLVDAGFSRVDAYWEDDDDVYQKVDSAENYESWIGYLVGWR